MKARRPAARYGGVAGRPWRRANSIAAEASCAVDASPLLADRHSLSLLERKEFDFKDLDQRNGGGGVIRRTKRFSIRLQSEHLSVSWDPSALEPKVRLLYI